MLILLIQVITLMEIKLNAWLVLIFSFYDFSYLIINDIKILKHFNPIIINYFLKGPEGCSWCWSKSGVMECEICSAGYT